MPSLPASIGDPAIEIEATEPLGPGDETHAVTLALVFRQEEPRLLRYFRRRAGQDLAPDLVQDVFVRAAGSAQAHSLSNPAAFIARIARNLLIDRARRHKHAAAIDLPLDEERDLATEPVQTHAIEAADLLRVYENALDLLPEKTRRVFLMHRVEELTYRDIHQRLGISVATVEYHMMKALRHIALHVDAAR
ncbi:RNA polymerase sigma factor [Novosphingobium sp. 9]|uniref:RNA polymerase sigma factor n=1 Tax=Novosphingobium sp. 9 TaxID=2025349 RepID=UPI0021B5CF20|nr:sigma-70 family RNA polymerase sigma factor [Novosphingobium sp. 9]